MHAHMDMGERGAMMLIFESEFFVHININQIIPKMINCSRFCGL